jgi:hypothetical protein
MFLCADVEKKEVIAIVKLATDYTDIHRQDLGV